MLNFEKDHCDLVYDSIAVHLMCELRRDQRRRLPVPEERSSGACDRLANGLPTPRVNLVDRATATGDVKRPAEIKRPQRGRDQICKIQMAGLSIALLLAALAPASAVESVKRPQSAYAPDPPASDPPMTTAPNNSYQGGGCFVTFTSAEAVRGIRHWRPGY